MKADHLVYDVMYSFSEIFSTFPLQLSFDSVAEHIITNPLETFTTFKECARQSVALLPSSSIEILESAKSTARSMQATRVAVRVFSILDLSAMQIGISSSKQCGNESWMKQRCKLYDQNKHGICLLYGSLPVWQKQLPSIAITYLRCAVKVAQRRFRQATANLEGESFMEVFTEYEMGSTALELEHLCDKLDNHVRSLSGFVESNCVVPETDPTNETLQTRESLGNVMKSCRALVLQFNNILPILYVVNPHLRAKLKNVWKDEVEDEDEWALQNVDPQHINPGAHFMEFNSNATIEMIQNIRSLHSAALHGKNSLNDIAEAQVSTIASMDFACAAIATTDHSDLKAFGYRKEEEKTPGTAGSSSKRALRSAATKNRCHPKKIATLVRNNHLQSDLFCTWCSITAADKFLEEELLASDTFNTSPLRMCLPDEWYELLISRILVPDLVVNAISAPYQKELLEASSRIMNRFAEKTLRSTQ